MGHEIAQLRERHNRKRTGKEVNAELANAAVTWGAEGGSKHFAKSKLLPEYRKLASQYCNSAEAKAVNECNKILGELKLPELPAPVPPTVEDLPTLSQDSFTADKLEETPWYNPWWNTEHDGDTIHAHIESLAKDWKQQIQKRKEGWINQLFTDHFTTYCEKRREHLRAHLQRLMADCDAAAKPKEEAASATEIVIGQMNEALRNLELPLANAIASMK